MFNSFVYNHIKDDEFNFEAYKIEVNSYLDTLSNTTFQGKKKTKRQLILKKRWRYCYSYYIHSILQKMLVPIFWGGFSKH